MTEPSHILNFPHQLQNGDALDAMCDADLILQARLHATKLIAAIQEGRMPPAPDVIKNIRNLNRFLQRWDTPLDLAFLDNL